MAADRFSTALREIVAVSAALESFEADISLATVAEMPQAAEAARFIAMFDALTAIRAEAGS